MSETLTAAQKSAETRKVNRARQAECEARRRAEREAIHNALLWVVKDPTATATDKVEASRLLLEMKKSR